MWSLFFISEYKKTKRNSRLDAISFMHVALDHSPCWVESHFALRVFLETKRWEKFKSYAKVKHSIAFYGTLRICHCLRFFRLTQISPPIFKCSRESQCQSWQFWSDRVGPHFSTFTACMTVVRVGGVQTHEGPCQKTSEWWQFTSACLQTAEWQCWKIHPLTINTFFQR